MRTLLLMPDGVSIRNFALTGLATALAALGDVDALVCEGTAPMCAEAAPVLERLAELSPYPESPLEAPLRRTLEYSHLRWCNTTGAQFNLDAAIPGSRRSRALRASARAVSTQFVSHGRVMALASAHDLLAGQRGEVLREMKRLEEWRPDVVLCAHQRPTWVLPVILAARRLEIPTATFIFSWDNLTTKGRIAAPFDHYLVWSDRMHQELRHFYPEIASERIAVVGTPQFEPYSDESLVWSRADFDERLGLESGRKLICFSGGDEATCPDDPEHLGLLCQLIADGAIRGNPHVVLRPAPVDTADRYQRVLERHPVRLSRPDWRATSDFWPTIVPSRRDIELLANLTAHSDVNVNMASTMTLDFAIHDTPVVNLGFDMVPERRYAERYYQFEHYRPVVEFGAARVARTPQQLADAINAYLRDPSLDREGRQRFVDFELRIKPGESISRIVETVSRIAASRVPAA